jgi:prepilin-type N-terminal cleavage/methylation domain-containing protein
MRDGLRFPKIEAVQRFPNNMLIKNGQASGFTLVEIICVVVIVGILVVIAVPRSGHGRITAQQNACINQLRQIDGAKDQWAIEHGKKTNDPVNEIEVNSYIKHGGPVCPLKGAYTYGVVGTNPTCSLSTLKGMPHRLHQ